MEVVKRTKKSKDWAGSTGLSGRVHHDKATINRILLSFRPIAPKPVTGGSGSDNARAAAVDAAKELKRRPKRKYVRVNKIGGSASGRSKCKSGGGKAAEDDNRKDLRFDVDGAGVFRLQASEPGESAPPEESGSGANVMMSFGMSMSISVNDDNLGLELGLGLGSVDRAVETWVVVSGLTETTVGGSLGSTDGEKMRNLEVDTCPGLISDGLHRVQWVNPAYKAMVAPPAAAASPAVRLVLNDNIPAGLSVFACTVRVAYTWRKEKHSKTMPCDVWKMDFGGFAWRLDTKAALCLGR